MKTQNTLKILAQKYYLQPDLNVSGQTSIWRSWKQQIQIKYAKGEKCKIFL